MMLKCRFVVILLFFCLASCSEYESLALEKASKRTADSLFRAHKDSLVKINEKLCDKNFDIYYNGAVDSIKETQLVKIKKLIDK